ncbi:MAG: response regulator transcription factor [Calditrichaceae bacterium]
MHILIADDEKQIAQSLKKSLQAEGINATLAFDGEETLELLQRNRFDAVLLDWRMPGLSGIEVCKSLRDSGNKIPILLLTALSDLSNKIEALNLGADDYITKPFSVKEVIARITAVTRRNNFGNNRIVFDAFELDLLHRTLKSPDDEIKLPEMEFELLKYFLLNKNSIICKEQLSSDVWAMDFYPTTNFIEATVKNLRKKLEEHCGKKFIKTIYGEGYIFIAD